MKMRRLPSLNVILNPARNVKGEEKEKLDAQHASSVDWALSKPVMPIPKADT
jgi:hypothetical protein